MTQCPGQGLKSEGGGCKMWLIGFIEAAQQLITQLGCVRVGTMRHILKYLEL